jgi:hypothetical protein
MIPNQPQEQGTNSGEFFMVSSLHNARSSLSAVVPFVPFMPFAGEIFF